MLVLACFVSPLLLSSLPPSQVQHRAVSSILRFASHSPSSLQAVQSSRVDPAAPLTALLQRAARDAATAASTTTRSARALVGSRGAGGEGEGEGEADPLAALAACEVVCEVRRVRPRLQIGRTFVQSG